MKLEIDRISFNGCRYVASDDYERLVRFCDRHDIPIKWIRYRKRTKRWYLRLWGRFKKVGK